MCELKKCSSVLRIRIRKSLQNTALLVITQYVKLLSVLLKVFNEIAVKGFCPVKEFEDDGEKGATEFKSSEEETGLGQGQGKEDVSDKIDNEDMLDGDDQKDAEDKEEDNGIEMSDNFESNMQDKKDDKKDGEDEDEEDDETKMKMIKWTWKTVKKRVKRKKKMMKI